MTVVLSDFKPASARVTIAFPDGFKVSLPNAQELTLGQLKALSDGDFASLYAVVPKKAHSHLDSLHAPQLTELIEGWLRESGTTPKE